MLDQLREFTEQTDMDELIALSVFAKGLVAEYQARMAETPKWLADKVEELNTVLVSKVNAYLAKAIRDAELRVEGFKSASEKKEDAVTLVAALKARKASLQQ